MENGVLFFYFTAPVTDRVIKDLSLLFFDIVAPPKQRPDHSGVRHIVCITRTLKVPIKWRITVIIKKRVEDFQYYSYFLSDHRYISQYKVYCLMSVRHI